MTSPSSGSRDPGNDRDGDSDTKHALVDLTLDDDSSDDDENCNVVELIRKYKCSIPSASASASSPSSPSSSHRSTNAARAGTVSSSSGASSRKKTGSTSSTPGSSKKRLRLEVGGNNDNSDGQYEYATAMMPSAGGSMGAAAMPLTEEDTIAAADAIAADVAFRGGSEEVFSPSSAMGNGTPSSTFLSKKRRRDENNVHIDGTGDDDQEVVLKETTESAYDPIVELSHRVRQFLCSVGITTAAQLLARPAHILRGQYAKWKEMQGFPQCKEATLSASVSSWKEKIRAIAMMRIADNPLDFLPQQVPNFLESIAIVTPEEFLKSSNTYLARNYIEYRKNQNLEPFSKPVSHAEGQVAGWKSQVRCGIRAKSFALTSPSLDDSIWLLPDAARNFLTSINVKTAEALLAYPTAQLVSRYMSWLKERAEPELQTTTLCSRITNWKFDVKVAINMKSSCSSDHFLYLPSTCQNFLKDIGINDAQTFRDTPLSTLSAQYVRWRQDNNLPALSSSASSTSIISGWKKSIRSIFQPEVPSQSNHKLSSNIDGDIEGLGNVGPQGMVSPPMSEVKRPDDVEMTSTVAANHRFSVLRTVATDRDAGSNDPFSVLSRIDQQFLLSVGMKNADDFLACCSDDLGSRLTSWLNDLGLPADADPSKHVADLQQKVQTFKDARDSTDRRDAPHPPGCNDEASNRAVAAGFNPYPLEQRSKQTAAKTASSSFRGPKQIAMKSTMNKKLGEPLSVSPKAQSNLRPITEIKQVLPLAEASTRSSHHLMYIEEDMEKVEGSSRTYTDTSTGLPVLEFSIYDIQKNGVVHDFRVHAAPSSIVGAGLGAFLTFVGSRQTTGSKCRLPNATFSLPPGRRIDLGKYGPHRDLDRKIYEVFEIKSFLFSCEPSEWAWDVQIRGRDQAIDITDDETGMIHAEARESCLVYVNETGNIDDLTPNIHSRQVGPPSARNIHYFYESDYRLQNGEAIELLINYKEMYEEIRERKGYGKRNRSGDTKSDAHLPSRLDRNFMSRHDLHDIFLSLGTKRLSSLVEFLVSTKESLVTAVESLLDQLQTSRKPTSVPYAQQLVALRRLCWLQPLIEKQMNRLKKAGVNTTETTAVIEENLPKLGWDSWSTLWGALEKNPDLKDKRAVNIFQNLQEEMMEEVFYSMLDALPYPLHEATWCSVGTRLMKDLCLAVVARSLSPTIENGEEHLIEYFQSRSLVAANEILNPATVDDLSFEASGVWKRYSLENRVIVKSASPGTKCVLVNRHSTGAMPEPVILESRNLDGIEIHQLWYLVRQVIVVLDVFAHRQFGSSADKPPEKPHEVTLSVMKELDIDDSKVRMFGFTVKVAVDPEDTVYQGKKKFTPAEYLEGLDRWKLEADPVWPANEEVVEDDGNVVGQNQQGTFSKQSKAKSKKNGSNKKANGNVSRPAHTLPPGVGLGEHHTPSEPLEGGWPEGWTRIFVQRKNDATATAGRLDRYWFSPIERFKLRSMVEVSKFIAFLSECNGDEKDAKRLLKSGANPKKNPTMTQNENNKKNPPPSAEVQVGTANEKEKSKASSSSLVKEPGQQLQPDESTPSSEPELVDLTDDSHDSTGSNDNNNNKNPHNVDRDDDESPDIPPETEI